MFLQGEVIMHFAKKFGLIFETIKALLQNLFLFVFSHVSQLVTDLVIKLNALKLPNHEIWNWKSTIFTRSLTYLIEMNTKNTSNDLIVRGIKQHKLHYLISYFHIFHVIKCNSRIPCVYHIMQ